MELVDPPLSVRPCRLVGTSAGGRVSRDPVRLAVGRRRTFAEGDRHADERPGRPLGHRTGGRYAGSVNEVATELGCDCAP
jgi:hypothetical protein